MAKPKTTPAAGTSPFAHLLGGAAALAGRALGKKAEEDTPIDDEGPTDEDQVVDDELDDVEDAPETGKKGKKAKGKKAEDDSDQEPEADADDDEDDCDDDCDTDKEKAAYQRGLAMGRHRESARAARIFSSPAAAGRPDLAATLAFTTRNTSAEAGRLLSVVGAASPAPTRRGAALNDRMASRTDPQPGTGGGTVGKPSFGQRVAAVVAKVNG